MIYIAIYGAFFIMFARKLAVHGHYRVNRNDLFPMACILLFVWVLGVLCHDDVSLHGVVYHISDALCCFYIMWAQRSNHDKAELQRELDGVRYTLLQQQKQYTVSQETIDIINRKCHDLKHQIRTLQTMQESPERDAYFAEAERAIMIYDTRIDTGNKALNTVLMKKACTVNLTIFNSPACRAAIHWTSCRSRISMHCSATRSTMPSTPLWN